MLTHEGLRLLAAHHHRIATRISVTGSAGSAAISQSKTVAVVLARRH
jgi:hypothetical protein